MMSAKLADDGEGERAARARARRNWYAFGLSVLGGLGVGVIFLLGKTGPGHTRPTYAAAAVLGMAIVLPLAIHFARRNQDEVDRLNELKANSLALYVCLFVGWSWCVLSTAALVLPPNLLVLIIATMLIMLGRYWMLKLRP
jgi:drug/metabolite transporter (DMT)-like permease